MYLLCSINYEIKNIEGFHLTHLRILEPNRPQMIIWRTRIACWLPKATDRHSEYATRVAFSLQQWLRERAPLTFVTLPVLFVIAGFRREDS